MTFGSPPVGDGRMGLVVAGASPLPWSVLVDAPRDRRSPLRLQPTARTIANTRNPQTAAGRRKGRAEFIRVARKGCRVGRRVGRSGVDVKGGKADRQPKSPARRTI